MISGALGGLGARPCAEWFAHFLPELGDRTLLTPFAGEALRGEPGLPKATL